MPSPRRPRRPPRACAGGARSPTAASPRRAPRTLLATLVVLLAGCGLQRDLGSGTGTAHPSTAPAIRAATLAGAPFDLASWRGHPVVIDFWGSWCDPCRAEQPALNRLYAAYAPRGVRFVGVDMRDDDASARAYESAFSVQYPSVADATESIAGAYAVAAPPTVFVVDGHGRVVLARLGSIDGVPATLDGLLAGASARRAPPPTSASS